MTNFKEIITDQVLQSISSKDDAQNFVETELAFANSGTLEVKKFASLSGVKINPNPESMSLNSSSIMLSELLMSHGSNQSILDLRLSVIDKVMEAYEIGKYSNIEQKREIRKICEQRGLKELLHFSRAENLGGIIDIGLNSKNFNSELLKRHRYNDNNRFDDRTDMISLSISYPNDLMFYKYRKIHGDENWVVVGLSISILWELECLFCYKNAATSEISSLSNEVLSRTESLERMFSDGLCSLGDKYPYDSQAEVLVNNHIPSSYIDNVYVKNRSDVEPEYRDIVSVNGFYFNRREYAVKHYHKQ